MAPISQDLSRISKATQELNEVANEATSQIRALDEFLAKLNPGIEHFSESNFYRGGERTTDGRAMNGFYSLAYGRDDDGKFGLVVRAVAKHYDADGEMIEDMITLLWVRKLDQVARPIRLAALAELPAFLIELANALEAAVDSGRKNLGATKDVAAELKSALQVDALAKLLRSCPIEPSPEAKSVNLNISDRTNFNRPKGS